MREVLYISYDGLTDPLGQSQVLPYLKFLSGHGFRFTVLSFEKPARLEKEGAVVQAIADKADIEWVPLTFTAKPPVLSKIYDRYRMAQTAIRLHKEKKFALVHCRSYVAAEVGLRLKEQFGVKMLFDMRGFWADEKVDNGQWDLKKGFYRKLYHHYKEKEKAFLLGADGIVSLTEAARRYLLQQPLYKDLSIEVIPCCADLHHFDFHSVQQQDRDALKTSLSVPADAKVVTYLGSVGGWYMTKEMFRFFKTLIENDPTYVMLILTKDEPAKVQQEALAMGIPEHKVIITYSDRKRLPVFLSLSSFSLFFIRNTFSKTASSPTKHAELMGMGIPVICNDIGDTGHIIEATKTGVVVNEFDKPSLQGVVARLKEVEGLDKEYIRSCAQRYFDLEAGGGKYLQLYRSILK